MDAPSSGSAQPEVSEKLDTVIYVPYLDQGTKIFIKRLKEKKF